MLTTSLHRPGGRLRSRPASRTPQSAWTGGDDLPTNPLACDGTPGTVGRQAL